MRLYTVIRNDQSPQQVKAEKFKTDSKDYIFSTYNPDSTYDIVIAMIPVDKVVEISSEEIDAPKRVYKIFKKDETTSEVIAECSKVVDGEIIFMNYTHDYTEFTTVMKVKVSDVSKIDVVS